jgi:hypothetical protein
MLVIAALVEASLSIVAEAVVRLVIVPVDEVSEAIEPDAEVRPAMLAVEIVVVARVDVPVTTKVLVVVLLVAVKFSINPVIAWNIDAKRLDDVA